MFTVSALFPVHPYVSGENMNILSPARYVGPHVNWLYRLQSLVAPWRVLSESARLPQDYYCRYTALVPLKDETLFDTSASVKWKPRDTLSYSEAFRSTFSAGLLFASHVARCILTTVRSQDMQDIVCFFSLWWHGHAMGRNLMTRSDILLGYTFAMFVDGRRVAEIFYLNLHPNSANSALSPLRSEIISPELCSKQL